MKTDEEFLNEIKRNRKPRKRPERSRDGKSGSSAAAAKEPHEPGEGFVPPQEVKAYYDQGKKTYWLCNARHEWQDVSKELLSLTLRHHGWRADAFRKTGLNWVEEKIMNITHEDSVHFAGPLAGFDPGLYEISGSRVLVTRGPKKIHPRRGPWPTLRKFLADLLGDQARYFYAWLKWAYIALDRGFPWSPGQMLAIAGPAGCGKSLLQNLVTQMLGGRAAKPYRYMIGESTFNAELFGAEHLMIEDEPSSSDLRTRRHFGAMVKSMVVNKEQSFHGKGRQAITLQPFIRLTISLNDEPESLMVLPPLDADIADKVILLHAKQVPFPFPSKEYPDPQDYWRALLAELPAFLHAMRIWNIPEDIHDQRYGVRAWHNPDLFHDLNNLSPENKLWALIEQHGLMDNPAAAWSGTAQQLEQELRRKDEGGEVARLLSFGSAASVYLGRLKNRLKGQVIARNLGERKVNWLLQKAPGTSPIF